jgi:hypothetical protein
MRTLSETLSCALDGISSADAGSESRNNGGEE